MKYRFGKKKETFKYPYKLNLPTKPLLSMEKITLLHFLNGHIEEDERNSFTIIGPRRYGKSLMAVYFAYVFDCDIMTHTKRMFDNLKKHAEFLNIPCPNILLPGSNYNYDKKLIVDDFDCYPSNVSIPNNVLISLGSNLTSFSAYTLMLPIQRNEYKVSPNVVYSVGGCLVRVIPRY